MGQLFSRRPQQPFIRISDITPTDIVFLVLGESGSGKSTIIAQAAGMPPPQRRANSLHPDTREILCVRLPNMTIGARSVVLVDTPGCDLEDISAAAMINNAMRRKRNPLRVDGTIFIYRTDRHLNGNVQCLLLEIGPRALQRPLVLLSAHWMKTPITPEEWENRLNEKSWWGTLKGLGATRCMLRDWNHAPLGPLGRGPTVGGYAEVPGGATVGLVTLEEALRELAASLESGRWSH